MLLNSLIRSLLTLDTLVPDGTSGKQIVVGLFNSLRRSLFTLNALVRTSGTQIVVGLFNSHKVSFDTERPCADLRPDAPSERQRLQRGGKNARCYSSPFCWFVFVFISLS